MKKEKKLFIQSHRWLFGRNRKEAYKIYSASTPEYIRVIITAYTGNFSKCFYTD